MRDLSILEQTILVGIINLEDDAYGVSIRKIVRKKTGKVIIYGILYRALDQLSRKAYVTREKGSSTTARDGSKKVYYSVTLKGKKALRIAYKLQKAIWDIIPDFVAD